MYRETQEYRLISGFELLMQGFNTLHFNRLDKEAYMLNIHDLKRSVQNHERARLEILLKFSKYSLQDLKNIFTSIEVETEAVKILEKLKQTRILA